MPKLPLEEIKQQPWQLSPKIIHATRDTSIQQVCHRLQREEVAARRGASPERRGRKVRGAAVGDSCKVLPQGGLHRCGQRIEELDIHVDLPRGGHSDKEPCGPLGPAAQSLNIGLAGTRRCARLSFCIAGRCRLSGLLIHPAVRHSPQAGVETPLQVEDLEPELGARCREHLQHGGDHLPPPRPAGLRPRKVAHGGGKGQNEWPHLVRVQRGHPLRKGLLEVPQQVPVQRPDLRGEGTDLGHLCKRCRRCSRQHLQQLQGQGGTKLVTRPHPGLLGLNVAHPLDPNPALLEIPPLPVLHLHWVHGSPLLPGLRLGGQGLLAQAAVLAGHVVHDDHLDLVAHGQTIHK
mmetsp:Transcript_8198/g.24913  ORF Transcript_8198/g.24913 Transcript_8198/m.24913 type:complete len:347 (-) Transcript_8198:201-1241(-)